MLEDLGAEVVAVVADPYQVRLIAETKPKTDGMDGRILAELLRTGALRRPLWRVAKQTRELRNLLVVKPDPWGSSVSRLRMATTRRGWRHVPRCHPCEIRHNPG